MPLLTYIMNLKNSLLLVAVSATSLFSRADVSGTWVNHPALDIYSYLYGSANVSGYNQVTNNVQKLIEGERYVYALISGGLYENPQTITPYSQVPFFVGRIDKSDPDARMEALASSLPLSGLGVTAIEYSQSEKCLALAYDNGCFDLIYDDGRIFSNEDLKNFKQPGGTKMRSISFSADGRQAVIATDYGIIVSDLKSATISNLYNFSKKVDFANILNGYMILSVDGVLRTFPVDKAPVSLNDTAILRSSTASAPAGILSDDAIKSDFGLYPVSENALIFVGPALAANTTGFSVNLLTLPGNPLEEEARVTNICSTSANYRYLGADSLVAPSFCNLPVISPTRDGIMAHNEANIYLINARGKSIDFSQANAEKNYVNEVLTTIRKDQVAAPDQQAGPERWKVFATFDGDKFWVFRPRHGFQLRSREGIGNNAKWSDAGEIVELNALAAGMPRYLYYSEKYGLIARSDGRNHHFTDDYCQNDGLSSFKNGEWTIHTLAKTNMTPGWMIRPNVITQTYTHGACPDPVLQDYVYTRGEITGIRRQNLADPSDVLLMTRSNYSPTNPNRASVCVPQTGSIYTSLTAFSEFDFDNDGTLWTAFDRLVQPAFPDLHAELWYWTADDRRNVVKGVDYDAHPMKIINIPGINPPMHGYVHAAKMEKNKNIIAHLADNTWYDSYFYDHNGTLEDTSDDKWAVLKDAIDQNGDSVELFEWPYGFIEDPYDGAFIIGSQSGVFVTSREELFNSPRPRISWLQPIRESDGACINNFGSAADNGPVGMTVDAEGRKWFVFGNGQIACLSPDRSKIIAEFDPLNSPIPNTTYLSALYNPETYSIFFGSYYGLTEFCLDGSGNPSVVENPMASPRIADAAYSGYINLSGLKDSNSYSLTAADGSVLDLPAPREGKIQINPRLYPNGTYFISGFPKAEFVINY